MRWIVLLLGLLSALGLRAQSDTYFALPPLYEWQGGQHTIEMYLSTAAPASTVWIYNSDTSYSNTLTVTSATPVTVTMSAIIPSLQSTYGARELNWSNSIRERDALFVEASAPITVTQRIVHQFNQEIITGKGRNALGTEFFVGSQTRIEQTVTGPNVSYEGMHYVSVVATEDSTFVFFKARPGQLFDSGQDSVGFWLDQGQSWVSIMQDNYELLGTRVQSTKPIAVTAGGNHLKSDGAPNADAGIDQVVPVEHLGTEYVVLRGMSFFPQDYFMVVATEDSTNVWVDGAQVLFVADRSDTYTHSMPGNASQPGRPFIVESDRPIYVFQVTTGTLNNAPELGMAQLPHVDCTGSTYVRYSRASGLSTSALVTVKTSGLAGLEYNGNPITSFANITTTQSTYDPNWTGVFIPNGSLTNNFTLEGLEPFHVGILAGEGSSTGLYGYISGFDDDFKLLDPVYAQPVDDVPLGALCATPIPLYFGYISCVDSITVLSAALEQGQGTVVDSIARDTILHAIIDPTYSGPVRVKVIVEDDRGYQDSIYYDFNYFGTTYDPIGDDTLSVCTSSPTEITVNQAGDGISYYWSTGDTTEAVLVSQPGWVFVTVDVGDCVFMDSVYLVDGSLVPEFADTAYCDSVRINFAHPYVASVYWPDFDTTSLEWTFHESGYYPYLATDINGCELVDSIYVRIIGKPYVDEGFSCPQYTLTAVGYSSFISMSIGPQVYYEPVLDTLFPFAGSHEIHLLAVDSCGNFDTISSVLEVDCLDDMLIYVPNAFSPNGDGLNDAFCLSSSLPERTRYSVFDRWGNQLFEGPSTECWDPQALGQEVSTGVFVVRTFTRFPRGEIFQEEYRLYVIP